MKPDRFRVLSTFEDARFLVIQVDDRFVVPVVLEKRLVGAHDFRIFPEPIQNSSHEDE